MAYNVCYQILSNLNPVLCPRCLELHQLTKIERNPSISLTNKFVIQVLEKIPKIYILFSKSWVRIKHIAIAKCYLFFHYHDATEISFYYFRDTKLCVKQKHTREFY